jgi:hypothetical protein
MPPPQPIAPNTDRAALDAEQRSSDDDRSCLGAEHFRDSVDGADRSCRALRRLLGTPTVGYLALSPLEIAMYNRAAKPKPVEHQSISDPLERGQFSDGRRNFVVRASSTDAPDSFQVHTKGNQSDVILVVSGLNTGNLHATWSEEWRTSTPSGASGLATTRSRPSTP